VKLELNNIVIVREISFLIFSQGEYYEFCGFCSHRPTVGRYCISYSYNIPFLGYLEALQSKYCPKR
ncbi:MAG: hypothetical protein AAF614_10920, partial [Chloroflexota bacterium]